MTGRPVSVIAEAIDALVAVCQTAPGLDGVQVVDGPPTSDFEVPVRALIIGGSEDPDDVLAAAAQPVETGLAPRDQEQFDIGGNVVVWDGGVDRDLALARRTAFDILQAVGDTLAGDHTLGGKVTRATLAADRQFGQRRTTDGVGAVIAFAVRVQALL
jgi:hypothetical protein